MKKENKIIIEKIIFMYRKLCEFNQIIKNKLLKNKITNYLLLISDINIKIVSKIIL